MIEDVRCGKFEDVGEKRCEFTKTGKIKNVNLSDANKHEPNNLNKVTEKGIRLKILKKTHMVKIFEQVRGIFERFLSD